MIDLDEADRLWTALNEKNWTPANSSAWTKYALDHWPEMVDEIRRLRAYVALDELKKGIGKP